MVVKEEVVLGQPDNVLPFLSSISPTESAAVYNG